MLENPKILLTILVISIILIVLLFRALKAEKKSRYALLEKEKELNNFRGYKEEVEQLRREILNSLPKGMEKISSLWADLNIIFDRLNEEIDDVLLKQCIDEIKKQRAEEENMHKRHIGEYLQRKKELEDEIYDLHNKKAMIEKDIELGSLKSQKKQIENEITSLLDTFDISVEEAKIKIECEENTPIVLKKIVDAWVEYKGIMWEHQLYSKLKNRKVGYATVDRLQTSLREFKQYNRVIIEPQKKEFMAWTVEEAEQKGFRRAKKYSFN